jgi:F-type H+-transporting ATPase subunit delta
MKINKRAKREAKELLRLCMTGDALDENRARQAAQEVAAAGHRNSHAVLAHFLRLVELEEARHTVQIESAIPLPEDVRTAIEAGLARRYGRELTTTYAQRPELIGGVRIQAASDVYDGTVLAGLEALERSF